MQTYIAFIRGVNVGGRNKVVMSELRQALENAGFKDVKTYIQSGNVIFNSVLVDTNAIAASIAQIINNTFGFEVPVLVMAKKHLGQILSDSPYNVQAQINTNKSYFVLLFDKPTEELARIFETLTYPNEQFQVSDTCVYLLCINGYGNAKLNNNLIEAKLGVVATARNYRTMQKILDLVDLV